jgi:hypothetical protein
MGREAEGVRMENPVNEKADTENSQRTPRSLQAASG